MTTCFILLFLLCMYLKNLKRSTGSSEFNIDLNFTLKKSWKPEQTSFSIFYKDQHFKISILKQPVFIKKTVYLIDQIYSLYEST